MTSWQPASPYSVWYPVTPAKSVRIRPVDGRSVISVRPVPPFVAAIAKKLIVISALLLTLPLILRRRRLSADRSAAGPRLRAAAALRARPVRQPVLPPAVPVRVPGLGGADGARRPARRVVRLVRVPAPDAGWRSVSTSIPGYTIHCVVYLAWSLPLLAFMAVHLYSPALGRRMRARLTRALPSLSGTRAALASRSWPRVRRSGAEKRRPTRPQA